MKLLHNLGVSTYRMSLSWSRIFPNGTGQPNAKGMDYYQRVVDELLANNITPYITLFHWDLPQALPGGWQSRDTAKAFADYAAYATRRLGDRVHHFMTTNEFACFTDLGYRVGQFAPGLKLPDKEANQVRHHGILAHGLAVGAIRANTPSGTEVGLAENANVYVPVIESREHIEAARRATREGNAPFLTALMEGKYIDSYLEQEGSNAPKVEPGDMKVIGSALDFVGLNIYTPQYVRADGSAKGWALEENPTSYPHMASPWLTIGPECIYWGVRNVTDPVSYTHLDVYKRQHLDRSKHCRRWLAGVVGIRWTWWRTRHNGRCWPRLCWRRRSRPRRVLCGERLSACSSGRLRAACATYGPRLRRPSAAAILPSWPC